MSLDFIEYEEQFGRFWHRLIGNQPSYRRYAGSSVSLASIRAPLATYFRAVGGDAALEIEAVLERSSGHRLRPWQRIAMAEEKIASTTLTENCLLLPEAIDAFPEINDNRELYWWLAAFMAHLDGPEPPAGFQGDIARLMRIDRAQHLTLKRFPGFRSRFERLAMALLHARPTRSLPRLERAVEDIVESLHRLDPSVPTRLHNLARLEADRRYRPFLPCPLWGQTDVGVERSADEETDDDAPGSDRQEQEEDQRRHLTERRELENSERPDPLTMIVKGEWLLLADQMGDVNRPDDDNDPDAANNAANDFDEIQLGRRSRQASSRISLALESGRQAVDDRPAIRDGLLYPEWHYRKKSYLRDHCRVSVEPVFDDGADWQPDAATRRRIRLVRRQFEALRPQRITLRQQLDGTDLDVDALVRRSTDLASGCTGSDRIYLASRPLERDLAVGVLMDCSLSTDSFVEDRRVLDVEKEALTALAYGIEACGDNFSIASFTSKRRRDVRIGQVKDFDEPMDRHVRQRIAGLRPGAYTRMGAALRHLAAEMRQRGERHRLILLITDGKPNDSDHYEGRFAIEDTRKAVIEARLAGVRVFAVTVDRRAESYVPFIFGRGGYSIIGHIGQLPEALPRLYRQITSQ